MVLAISKNYYLKRKGSFVVYDKRKPGLTISIVYIDTKIKIYEDRVKTWFFEQAQRLKNNEAGFVRLAIAASYIEGNQQYREGKSSKGKSRELFGKALKRIFNLRHKSSALDHFYDAVRCGLFHDGMTGKSVTISGEYKKPIRLSEKKIQINPNLFLGVIKQDFKEYVEELKDPINRSLRINFDKYWQSRGR